MVEEQTQKLYALFEGISNVFKVIPWKDAHMAGVSILKEYPYRMR